jgi:hypothetical protein
MLAHLNPLSNVLRKNDRRSSLRLTAAFAPVAALDIAVLHRWTARIVTGFASNRMIELDGGMLGIVRHAAFVFAGMVRSARIAGTAGIGDTRPTISAAGNHRLHRRSRLGVFEVVDHSRDRGEPNRL